MKYNKYQNFQFKFNGEHNVYGDIVSVVENIPTCN